jgi:hypothetical protein
MEFMGIETFCSRGITWQEGQYRNGALYINVIQNCARTLLHKSLAYANVK